MSEQWQYRHNDLSFLDGTLLGKIIDYTIGGTVIIGVIVGVIKYLF